MRACCEPVTALGVRGGIEVLDTRQKAQAGQDQVGESKGGVAEIRVGRSRVRFVLPLLKKGVSVWGDSEVLLESCVGQKVWRVFLSMVHGHGVS